MTLIDDLGNTVHVDEETAKLLLERPGYRLPDGAESVPKGKRAGKTAKK